MFQTSVNVILDTTANTQAMIHSVKAFSKYLTLPEKIVYHKHRTRPITITKLQKCSVYKYAHTN